MGEHVAVVSDKSVFVIGGGGKVSAKAEIGAPPTAVAISPGGNDVAVGLENGEIWLYGHDLGKLTKKGEPLKKHSAEVTALAFSPTGAHLASCCAGRSVFAWELASMAPVSTSWVAHKAKVTCLAWSPSGKYLASGGVDSSVIVWYMEKPSENTTQRLAHDNGVTAIGFVSEDMVISTGQVRAHAPRGTLTQSVSRWGTRRQSGGADGARARARHGLLSPALLDSRE